ncbi:MAG: YybH family protein [Xanthomarina gelatinilytica]|uniref:YybH family protein n=1 Tax=Xanthomarina gelatinilytica TaxID=1137281 RepID=UPI003A85F179
MKLRLFLLSMVITLQAFSQQVTDLDFPINIKNPKYQGNKTALIGIDASHNNLHKLDGGFAPYAKLLKADGYQMVAVNTINQNTLKSLNTLVIANAIHPSNVGNWKRPITNAFSVEEIDLLEKWVSNGGSLMVVADHMPYAGATNELAKKFGFSYEDGFVMSESEIWPPESYSKKQGNLFETPITIDIDSIAGFTGSGLRIPKNAIAIASFPKTHQLLIPEEAWQFETNTKKLSADDLVMGAIMQYGKGKVAFFTEAAMFTAQIVQDRFKVGFNSPRAPQNLQFVLNTIHWLDNGHTINRDEHQSDAYKIVQEILLSQEIAYEANKMLEVANHYTSDGIIYEPTGQELRGIVAIRAYWQQLSGKAVSWDTQILEVEAVGDQIIAICRFDISFKQTEENTATASSKAFLTFKKEDGVFKLHRDFYMQIRG